MTVDSCPAPGTISEYLAGDLAGAERERAERHLSHCAACRRTLTAAWDAAQPAPDLPTVPAALRARLEMLPAKGGRSPHQRARWRAPLALAAAVLIAIGLAGFYLGRGKAPNDVAAEVLRAGETLTLAPALVAPADGAAVTGRLVFRWRPVAGAGRYTVSVLDARGDIVGRFDGEQTSADASTLQPRLPRAQTFYWFVTAQLEDGGTSTSEVQTFTLGPPPP